MTSLNPSLRLALINKAKSKKNILQRGFTLVELMIVIVVVGVLSATALPQFLGVKDKAEVAASIAEDMGLARECAAAVLIGTTGPSVCTPTATSGNAMSVTSVADTKGGTECGGTALAAGKSCVTTVAAVTGAISQVSS